MTCSISRASRAAGSRSALPSNAWTICCRPSDLLRPQAEARGLGLVVERAASAPASFETDALRLQQVLVNLVANAIKFSSSGSVRLLVQPLERENRPWLRFEVTDPGIGMTAEQLAALFQPFTQADASTARRFGGTGLGLSMSALLVESMGGAISADSRLGEGSTFRVDLPLVSARSAAAAMRGPAAAETQAAAPARERLGGRVLVVDDSEDNRRLIRHFLVRAGAEVETADGGAEGLRLFERARQAGAPHDVVVMDIQMPGMDGFAARQALREAGCRVPIIALTAHAMVSERTRCLGAGFTDYASKPIDRAALIEFVGRNLARSGGSADAALPSQASALPPARRLSDLADALVEWLAPPHAREDPRVLQRTRTLLYIGLAPLLILPLELWTVLRIWEADFVARVFPMVVMLVPLCLSLPLLYRWSASMSVAANAMAAYVTAAVAVMLYWGGGAGAIIAGWFSVIPMGVFAIAGARSALFWLGAVLVVDVGFWAVAAHGVSLARHVPPERLAFGATLSNAGLAMMLTAFALAHERAQNEAVDTLSSANRWLQDARRHAERANRTKSMFLANISHELRTPMAAILGFADRLSERASSQRVAAGLGAGVLESLHRIRNGGRRLLALINDLLDLAKLEAGSLRLESLELDPTQLIATAGEPLRARAGARGVEFGLEIAADVPGWISGDPLRIAQIVTNLCDNAIKFTSQGRVSVSASVRRDTEQAALQIAVADTGCGIPAEHLPTLFTAFQQLDSSLQRERGGSGLGLALCYRLAERMGGSIRVTSEPGVGSRFTLELPLHTGGSPSAPARVVLEGRAAAAQLRGLRVLLAEDGLDGQRLMARVLRDAGVGVDVVENGLLAVDRALAGDAYDLILMDVEMPVLDGLAATGALRDAGYYAPVLALTANLADEHERCLAAGCDGVASKPVDWPSLFAQIAALCDAGKVATLRFL